MEMQSSVVDPQQPQRGTNTGNGSAAAAASLLNTPVDGAGDGMMAMGMGMMGDDSPVSHNDEDLSDGDVDRDDPDSCDELRHHRAAAILADHGDVLAKLKMQVRDIKVGEDFDGGSRTHLTTPTSAPTSAHFNPRTGSASLSPGSSLPPNFSLPVPFPFPHPAAAAAAAAAAFLPPLAAAAVAASHHHHSSMAAAAAAAHGGGGPPQQQQGGGGGGAPSSGSSHSSEGSASSQHTWSFEEQFKQVRQLYEINDDPKRKEFLDDLFSFMQKRGTPINRLPIMAKSVLDLYELYNLVIARGGLVDVINKKLWQEIIKGLHLPSSITSAAFTLRTQYMKYLYPYECEKRRLSTPAELQAAIDGNRREGRRSSYGQYEAGGLGGGPGGMGGGGVPVGMLQQQRSPNPTQMSPLASLQQQQQHLAARMGLQSMGLHNGAHHPSHPTPLGVQPLNGGPLPGLAPSEFEARMLEYVKLLNKEIRSTAAAAATTPPPSRGSAMGASVGEQSPPGNFSFLGGATSPTTAHLLTPLEMSRMTLWNLYNNNHTPLLLDSQPQKEALNLADAANAALASHHHHQQQQQQQQQQQHMVNMIKREMDSSKAGARVAEDDDGDISPPPSKRFMLQNSHHHEEDEDEDMDDEEEEADCKPPVADVGRSKTDSNKGAVGGGPSTNIKITSRGDVRTGDSSLVVSMELNGVTYQGVLFAQQQHPNSHQPQTARTAITS